MRLEVNEQYTTINARAASEPKKKTKKKAEPKAAEVVAPAEPATPNPTPARAPREKKNILRTLSSMVVPLVMGGEERDSSAKMQPQQPEEVHVPQPIPEVPTMQVVHDDKTGDDEVMIFSREEPAVAAKPKTVSARRTEDNAINLKTDNPPKPAAPAQSVPASAQQPMDATAQPENTQDSDATKPKKRRRRRRRSKSGSAETPASPQSE